MPKIPALPIIILYFSIPLILPTMDFISTQNWLDTGFWLKICLWISGAILGLQIIRLDQLVDVYFANPQSQLALTFKKYFVKTQRMPALRWLWQNRRFQTRLTFRSALFQLIWLVMAFFTLTSTSVIFGKAFVLGLGMAIILDQWQLFLTDKNYLNQQLFWQIPRLIQLKELKLYLLIMTALLALMPVWVRL